MGFRYAPCVGCFVDVCTRWLFCKIMRLNAMGIGRNASVKIEKSSEKKLSSDARTQAVNHHAHTRIDLFMLENTSRAKKPQ